MSKRKQKEDHALFVGAAVALVVSLMCHLLGVISDQSKLVVMMQTFIVGGITFVMWFAGTYLIFRDYGMQDEAKIARNWIPSALVGTILLCLVFLALQHFT